MNTLNLKSQLLYVSSSSDSTVMIGFNLGINDGYIVWFDTVKERMMKINKILKNDEYIFEFERSANEGGGIYTFIPMSLATYNEKVKSRILIPQNFDNEEDLRRAFLKTIDNAW